MQQCPYIVTCLVIPLLLLHAGCGSSDPSPVVQAPPPRVHPLVVAAREAAGNYVAGDLMDYEVVWTLYDLDPNERSIFLDGFIQALADDEDHGRAPIGAILQGAVSGNHFATARDLGSRHAAGAATNEQVQGAIRSSRHVSEAVSLGWKAGYIRGFSAQQVAETAAKGFVNEAVIERLNARAAATYNALRATTGK